jgi:hypothetical protein
MTKQGPPTHRLLCKPRDGGKEAKRTRLFALWYENGRWNVKAERGSDDGKYVGVAAIKLTDGTIVRPDQVYFDLYENRDGQSERRSSKRDEEEDWP